MSPASATRRASSPAADSRSGAPRTVDCPGCGVTLITRGLLAGQQLRCGRCGHQTRFGKQEKVDTHQLAWRSFWLGLPSCVLLFLTGIPAVYYGIRSLLRMRFVRSEPIDRVAAIAGTALGGCFGIGVSGLLLLIGGAIALAVWSTDRTEDPDEVRQRWAAYFSAPLPDHVEPRMAQTVFQSEHKFRFNDHDLVDRRTLGIQFIYKTTMVQVNTGQILNSARKANLPERAEEIGRLQQEFNWHAAGERVQVTKRVLQFERLVDPLESDLPPPPDAPRETITLHQYLATIPQRDGLYVIALVIDPEHGGMTELEIRDWFAQVQLVQ